MLNRLSQVVFSWQLVTRDELVGLLCVLLFAVGAWFAARNLDVRRRTICAFLGGVGAFLGMWLAMHDRLYFVLDIQLGFVSKLFPALLGGLLGVIGGGLPRHRLFA